ncbi:MAG: putative DNA binding domain-containing protein [Actinobacteria bacterium]|nr:putative DNA binding domain-containing protein [Actinomycetota bacterium]MBI3688008.1 putative DNA binding domain-containing protein [Actinomycetota bacterium]
MTDDLAQTLGRRESATLEFKRTAKDRNKLREAICALANDLTGAGGGDLLIGVADDGTACPVDASDRALLAITAIRDEGNILDRPSMVVDRALFNGHEVIRVHVHASHTPPVRLDGVAWVRPGPSTRRASTNDERVLSERSAATALPFDARGLAGSALADLDVELLRSTYITAAVAPEVLAENERPLPQQLRSLRLIDPAGTPTALGVLLGGFDPTAAIPGAYIQFVRYDGDDADAMIRDEEELRDNLITATRTLTALLQAHMTRRVDDVDGLAERGFSDYPLPALREAILNAVVHRTYDGTHAPVRILWFDDRVEVSNPGGPFGVVDEHNYDRVNDYRNPSLAAAMKTLGYVNRFGRGIERMRRQLESNGNPPPEFEVDRSWWKVTVRRLG